MVQLSEYRPVESVPPTKPLHLPVKPAAPHVDKTAFPGLPSSPRDGIGGIPGSKEYPQGNTEGFQAAFKKPAEGTIVPRATSGKTSAPPSTTTTVTTASPAVTMAVTTTAATTTSAPGSSTTMVKQTLDPKVTVTQLPSQLVGSARVKLAAKADPNRSGQGKAGSKAPSEEEAMEVDTSQDGKHRSSSRVRTSRSRDSSTKRDSEKRDTKGKTSHTNRGIPRRSLATRAQLS